MSNITVPYECSNFHAYAIMLPLHLCPQSRHQQGPLLRNAGSQEEESVIHEEALELISAPDVALDRAGGPGNLPCLSGPGQRPQLRSASDLSMGISLGYILGLALGLYKPEKQEACWGF